MRASEAWLMGRWWFSTRRAAVHGGDAVMRGRLDDLRVLADGLEVTE